MKNNIFRVLTVFVLVGSLTLRNAVAMNNEQEDICAICQEDLSAQQTVDLLCNPTSTTAHTFHDECLLTWVKGHHGSCPFCQKNPAHVIKNGQALSIARYQSTSLDDLVHNQEQLKKIKLLKGALFLNKKNIMGLQGLHNLIAIKNWHPSIIKKLNLCDNQIVAVDDLDDAATLLPSLEDLWLYSNKLEMIPAHAFARFPTLKKLYLNNNLISSIADSAFAGLPMLQELYLVQNQLTTISQKTFAGLSALQELYLNHNLIETLPDDTFAELTALQRLKLSDNHISPENQRTVKKSLKAHNPTLEIEF